MSPLSATLPRVEWGRGFQDQGNHSGHPKLLTKDGITADLGDHSAWPSRRTSLPIQEPDNLYLLGTLVGGVSVSMKLLEKVLLHFIDQLNC